MSFNGGLLVATCKWNKLVFLAWFVAHRLRSSLVYQLCSTAFYVFLMTIVQAPTPNNVSPHLNVATLSVKVKKEPEVNVLEVAEGMGFVVWNCKSNKSVIVNQL